MVYPNLSIIEVGLKPIAEWHRKHCIDDLGHAEMHAALEVSATLRLLADQYEDGRWKHTEPVSTAVHLPNVGFDIRRNDAPEPEPPVDGIEVLESLVNDLTAMFENLHEHQNKYFRFVHMRYTEKLNTAMNRAREFLKSREPAEEDS